MITPYERRMRIVFAIAFAVLFSTIAVSIFVINQLNITNDWVVHTHEVMACINDIHINFGDARVSTKNYLLSHQPRHLAPRHNAFQVIDKKMAYLAILTHDNPQQQIMIKKTTGALHDYIELTRAIIVEVDNDDEISTKFPIWMDQTENSGYKVSQYLVQMRQEEEHLLREREKVASSFVTQAYSIMPFMLFVQLTITTYIYYTSLHINKSIIQKE